MLILILSSFFMPLLSAAACDLDVSMINQDPYPAIPGDYVKVVFQIDGIENPECGLVSFEVKENYPFSLDPNVPSKVSFNAGTYSRSYSSFYLATYKLRVDNDALEGNNPIEVLCKDKSGSELIKEFDIYTEDTKANFEVHVKDYDYAANELTLEILNIADADIEALTVEIPKQDGVSVKGANIKVVGDLDSNEYTTTDFKMTLPEGESKITLRIIYTDAINVRREITKEIEFDSMYFSGSKGGRSGSSWIWTIIILGVVGGFVWRHVKKKRAKKKRMMERHGH